jgi:hypothetical protein
MLCFSTIGSLSRLFTVAVAAAILLGQNAKAGIIRLGPFDPGTRVQVYLPDPNDPTKRVPVYTATPQKDDRPTVPMSGMLSIGLGTLEQEKMWKKVGIEFTSGGVTQFGEESVSNATSLGATEPFRFPLFGSAVPGVFATTDVSSLLAQGYSFTAGEVVNVVNGSIPESPFVTFHVSPGAFSGGYDDSFVNSLPLYNGTATVIGLDELQPVPEPAGVSLLVLGAVALFAYGWHKR